jgi:hypothetical protein
MPVISGPVGATGASGGAQLDYVERTSDSAGLAITSTSDGNSNGQQFIDGNAVTQKVRKFGKMMTTAA